MAEAVLSNSSNGIVVPVYECALRACAGHSSADRAVGSSCLAAPSGCRANHGQYEYVLAIPRNGYDGSTTRYRPDPCGRGANYAWE